MEMRTLKSETTLQAVRGAQTIVNSVLGGLNQRLADLAVKVTAIEVCYPKGKLIESDGPTRSRASKMIAQIDDIDRGSAGGRDQKTGA
jgi:hypothetical protein